MSAFRLRLERAQDEAGFTLIEVMVAMVLFSIVATTFLSVVLGASRSSTATKEQHDVNEEARLAVNRVSRELRQAKSISATLNSDGPGFTASAVTALTFKADFDGDGCINGTGTPVLPATTCNAYSSSNPEILTYCYDPGTSQLLLIQGVLGGATCSAGLPILATGVTSVKFEYRSNLYLWDTNADGITTWMELDSADPPIGNGNGDLDSVELANVDSVVINLTMLKGTHQQSYRTQVALRNNS
ncbi:MAG: prepilin-type N-terminal cleavage/methylation domain-containing protein [Actinomycetota bacterium]